LQIEDNIAVGASGHETVQTGHFTTGHQLHRSP